MLALVSIANAGFQNQHQPVVNRAKNAVSMLEGMQSRRNFLLAAGMGAVGPALGAVGPAYALGNEPLLHEIVPGQVTVADKIDVNNSPVADYMMLPGMYPTIAGKLATSGPYNSLRKVYEAPRLSQQEKQVIKKYEPYLVVTAPNPLLDPMRGRE